MTDSAVYEVRSQDLRRLLSLDAWTRENARVLQIWRLEQKDVARLLRRNEESFAGLGVALRHGNAWRLVEPYGATPEMPAAGGFLHALVERVSAERARKEVRQ